LVNPSSTPVNQSRALVNESSTLAEPGKCLIGQQRVVVDGSIVRNGSSQSVIEERIIGIGQWAVLIVYFHPRFRLRPASARPPDISVMRFEVELKARLPHH